MFVTHIYIETDSTVQRMSEKSWGYVLECVGHEDKPVRGFGRIAGTYHQAVLTALGKALERFNQNSEIHIHTRDAFVLTAMQGDLVKWAEKEFQNARGESISNRAEWEKVWKYARRHKVIPEQEKGDHIYSGWLRWEMEVQKANPNRRENGGKN